MKIKKNFILRTIAGSNVVVPVGGDVVNFNGMISLNETGAFLWKELQSDKTSEELAEAMMAEYEVDKDTAAGDVKEFLITLEKAGIIEE